jgi:NAD(P)-dependent dehydrogenase (short-subunit alcohol dehydrogenase family)
LDLKSNPPTDKATAVANAINSAGAGRALAVVGDILDDAYITTLVSKAAEFGNGKIHILVNNAGFTWDGVVHKVCILLILLSPCPFPFIFELVTNVPVDDR